jgi:two-component system, LytTR family, sensor kinase
LQFNFNKGKNNFVLVGVCIFSEKLKYKITRHLAFWLVYYVYTVFTNLPDFQINTFTTPSLYIESFNEATEFLPVYLFSVYFSIYYILPGYLSKKGNAFLIHSFFFLVTITVAISYVICKIIFEKSDWQWDELDVLTLVFKKSIGEQIIISGSAIIIKIIKDYSLKQRENEILAIENTRNKIQLLKMQMHPRILFECLHNIYIDIEAGTINAPEMIIKFSDLLSYLLYEGEMKQVPLNLELKMVENYIALKKIAYKNNLNFNIETSGDTNGYFITPGLFLPLLELGFVPFEKTGKPLSVSIILKTDRSKIYFHLKNNVPGNQIMETTSAQEALEGLKKRLQLFHLSKYIIETHSTIDSFTIELQVEKDKRFYMQNQNSETGESMIYEHS